MTRGTLPYRGWVAGGITVHRLSLFERCLHASKLRRHVLTPAITEASRERITAAVVRYCEQHQGTPPVTLTDRTKRLHGVSVAARRLASDPESPTWRKRLAARIAPLFLEDVGAADFVHHVLLTFERRIGEPHGLARFLITLRSKKRLDDYDVGRCRVLAEMEAMAWKVDPASPLLPGGRDPHRPGLRDPYMVGLIVELAASWKAMTGRSVLAKDPIDKRVYFAEWLALVVRKATRGKVRPAPGTILDAARSLPKSEFAARVRGADDM